MKIGDRSAALVTGAALLLATTALTAPALAQTAGRGTGGEALPASPTPSEAPASSVDAPAGASTGGPTDSAPPSAKTAPDGIPAAGALAAPAPAPAPTPEQANAGVGVPSPAQAQASAASSASNTNVSEGRSGVVRRILVEGNERIESSTIVAYLPISIGDTVDAARLDLSLKTLSRTDLFADERVTFDPATGDLTVRVVENPIINQVVFEGNSALADDKLRDEISIHPRGIYTKRQGAGRRPAQSSNCIAALAASPRRSRPRSSTCRRSGSTSSSRSSKARRPGSCGSTSTATRPSATPPCAMSW